MKASMIFGGLTVTAEGDTKEVFVELAAAAEVFGQNVCGSCGSEHTAPVVRDVDGVTYYEMKCHSCGCTLGFGQTKVGGRLFPRRKDKTGDWLPNRGWADHRAKYQQQPASEPF
jgi:hypothetical protein